MGVSVLEHLPSAWGSTKHPSHHAERPSRATRPDARVAAPPTGRPAWTRDASDYMSDNGPIAAGGRGGAQPLTSPQPAFLPSRHQPTRSRSRRSCAPSVPRAPLASAETAQQVGAGLLATAAGFGADAAVLMHVGVGFAFCGAACAGNTAGFQEGSGDVGVVAGVPG
jgi:hypothetical protein